LHIRLQQFLNHLIETDRVLQTISTLVQPPPEEILTPSQKEQQQKEKEQREKEQKDQKESIEGILLYIC